MSAWAKLELAEFCEIGVATGGLYSLEVTTALWKGVGHEVAWTAAALCEGGNRAGTWWRWFRWLRAPAGEVHGRNSSLTEFCEIGVVTGGLYSLEVTTAP